MYFLFAMNWAIRAVNISDIVFDGLLCFFQLMARTHASGNIDETIQAGLSSWGPKRDQMMNEAVLNIFILFTAILLLTVIDMAF